MAIEGLAYMAFTYVDCHPERAADHPATDDASPIDSLLRLAGSGTRAATNSVTGSPRCWPTPRPSRTAGSTPELLRSGLQFRIARTLGEGHPLINAAPGWVDDAEIDWGRLYYAVTLLYFARPGDFVLLHLITSLHAVEQLAERLPADLRRHAVHC